MKRRPDRYEAAAIQNAWDAAWYAAQAMDALASALAILGTQDALHRAVEAAGAARMAREWAGEMAGER